MREILPFRHFGQSLEWCGTAGHFPCAVLNNLRWWVGPQSDLMSAPSPPLGPRTGVYLLFPSPRGGIHCGVGWGGPCGYLYTARLVVLGIWHISWGGSARCTGAGGAGSPRFSFGDLLWEGPCGTRRESDLPPEGWICRSTPLHGASKFPDRNWFPLEFWLGDGRGRWPWRASLFPAKLSSVSQGSTTLPPSVLLPSPLSKSRAVDF